MSKRPITPVAPPTPAPLPGELYDNAMMEIAVVTHLLVDLHVGGGTRPRAEDVVERLSDLLDRADAANITTRLANARADMIAAVVHADMRGEELCNGIPMPSAAGRISRGQAIGRLMQKLGRSARNSVTRPLIEAERRHKLPDLYPATPRAMSRSQRISAGIEDES